MLFFPVGCLALLGFVLLLPVLFLLGYFHVVTLGFENLGVSSEATLLILISILLGSAINIPFGKRKLEWTEESFFFGLFRRPKLQAKGIAVNLGGAVIPTLLSFYFLFQGWQSGCRLFPVIAAVLVMTLICRGMARIVPGRGIVLSPLVPPVFSAVFALILAPQFAPFCAFVAGTLGTLIGADLFNLKRAQRAVPGMISIGGAGVFDGIFLMGIVSALLAGF